MTDSGEVENVMNSVGNVILKSEDNLFTAEFKSNIASNEIPFTPSELHQKYSEFINKFGHNASSELVEMDDQQQYILENFGSEFMPEVESRLLGVSSSDLFQSNKRLQDKNTDLEKKIDQLLRSLEVAEDEAEQLKKHIDINDKQLRCYDDMRKDRDFLENEMDRLQTELGIAEERKVMYESHIKHLKDDKEEMHLDMKNQRDQIDNFNQELRSLHASNKSLFDENTLLKSRVEGLEDDVEIKEKELEQKLQLYQEVREQAEEYKTSVQNLLEEKKMLITKLHETQAEASLLQAGLMQSTSSPLRAASSLQTEIEEAEQVFEKSSSSPLFSCPNTPARSSFNISIDSNYSYRKSESLTQVILHLNEATEREVIIDSSERLNKSSDVSGVSATTDRVLRQEKEIQDLNQLVLQSKAKEEYLVHQLGQKQSKMRELASLNEKRVSEIALLCEIIQKLGTSKLETWLENSEELQIFLKETNKTRNRSENTDALENLDDKHLNGSFSQLLDALSLESVDIRGAKYLKSGSSSITSLTFSNSFNNAAKRFIQTADDVIQFSKSSLGPRLGILEKTKSVIEEAIVKKLGFIDELLKESAQYHQQQGKASGCIFQQLIEVSHDVSDHLSSALDLIRKYARCYKPIGALEAERKFSSIMEVFVNHMKMSNQDLSSDIEMRVSCSTSPCSSKLPLSSSSNNSVGLPTANVDISESSIDSITSVLMRSVVFPTNQAKLSKCLLLANRNQSVNSLVDSVLHLNGKLQSALPVVGRTTMLMITFFLCTFFSISPVDYKVEPVY